MEDLEKRLPEDTSVHFHYTPAVRALIALNAHDPVKAIQLLQANVPYELGSPQRSFDGFYGVLYPIYVRGLAYRMLHRGSDAASEFRKILDHPGIVANDPIGALAHLQLDEPAFSREIWFEHQPLINTFLLCGVLPTRIFHS